MGQYNEIDLEIFNIYIMKDLVGYSTREEEYTGSPQDFAWDIIDF